MVFEISGEFFQAMSAAPGWFSLFETDGRIYKIPIAFWVVTKSARPTTKNPNPSGKTCIRPVGPVGDSLALLDTLANERGIIGPGLGESVPEEDYPKYGIEIDEPEETKSIPAPANKVARKPRQKKTGLGSAE